VKLEKRGFGGKAPNKLRPVLKARGVSLQMTHAVGTAKSLSLVYKTGWLERAIGKQFM